MAVARIVSHALDVTAWIRRAELRAEVFGSRRTRSRAVLVRVLGNAAPLVQQETHVPLLGGGSDKGYG